MMYSTLLAEQTASPRSGAPVAPAGRRDLGTHVVGPLRIDTARRQVFLAGTPIRVTRIQFRILMALAEQDGAALSRHDLLTAVWGSAWTRNHNSLDVHIRNLRHKLGDDPARPLLIVTVRGVGFRLSLEGWHAPTAQRPTTVPARCPATFAR